MRLLICGSSAAEGIPAIFCQCPLCAEARRRGGKDLRSRTAYQLGDAVRVDLGPDFQAHTRQFGLDTVRLRHLFMTHAHADHFYPPDLGYRRKGFSDVPGDARLEIYGVRDVWDAVQSTIGDALAGCNLEFKQVAPGDSIELHELDMTFVAHAANHCLEMGAGVHCVFYSARVGKKWILFGNDTGWFPDETWEALKKIRHDVAIIDATYGKQTHKIGHMGVQAVADAFKRLESQGSLVPGAVKIANHFSHNGGMLHRDLETFFQPLGIQAGYDGMTVEV